MAAGSGCVDPGIELADGNMWRKRCWFSLFPPNGVFALHSRIYNADTYFLASISSFRNPELVF